MAHYLVTGGAGFIGSHIVEVLLSKGNRVRVLDNLLTGKWQNIEPFKNQIEFIKGDIRNLETCQEACKGVDYVLHQAALGSVPRSIEDPQTNNEINIGGTLNMLVAARDNKAKRLVFASSSSIYGDTPELPKIETMPPNLLSPYALSKYTGETYALMFHQLYGLETIALRYFNVFGPKQDPDSPYAAVIPRFVTALLMNNSPIIYGDGEQARDFTFIADVVNANLLACSAESHAVGQVYNVACHQMVTVNQLFIKLRDIISERNTDESPIWAANWTRQHNRAAGKVLSDCRPNRGPVSKLVVDIEPKYQKARPGDVKNSLASIEKIKENLGYRPSISFEEGLRRTVKRYPY